MESALSSPVLVGREDLVALAERRPAAAARRTGDLLFLAGEAGIGKTRLLAEIVRRADGFTVLTAGAAPGDDEVAAGLLADLAAELRRQPATADAGERVGRRLRGRTDGDAHRQRRLLVTDLTELLAGAAHLARTGPTAAREWLARTSALLTERSIPGTLGALPHGRGLVELHEGQTGKARESLAAAATFWAGRRRFWEGTAALVDQARCATRSRRPGVAAGLTNREIAAALTIAPRTAAAHVEHIRTKLGVSRRAQIAAWVATLD